MSEVLEYATDIPFWVNIFPTFLDIDKTTSFSLSPFPIAPGSLPPCPGSINTFLAPVTGGNIGSPSPEPDELPETISTWIPSIGCPNIPA